MFISRENLEMNKQITNDEVFYLLLTAYKVAMSNQDFQHRILTDYETIGLGNHLDITKNPILNGYEYKCYSYKINSSIISYYTVKEDLTIQEMAKRILYGLINDDSIFIDNLLVINIRKLNKFINEHPNAPQPSLPEIDNIPYYGNLKRELIENISFNFEYQDDSICKLNIYIDGIPTIRSCPKGAVNHIHTITHEIVITRDFSKETIQNTDNIYTLILSILYQELTTH